MHKKKRRISNFESSIHVWRATRRMTQQQLADEVGVSRQTIIQLERNRYNPSLLLAYDIAAVFGVTIDKVFKFNKVKESESCENSESSDVNKNDI